MLFTDAEISGNRLQPGALAADIETLHAPWRACLQEAAAAQALQTVATFVEGRLADGATVYPSRPLRALHSLLPSQVRVVILGQDPYHGPGQAQGLAFSVPDACPTPRSLRNIQKEIARDTPQARIAGNDLTPWTAQGVLLLNTSLTVEDGQAGAHARRGWEAVTDALINAVAAEPHPKVFMLWGGHAQAKEAQLPAGGPRLVLKANHPSPLSASRPPIPFLGCGHFSQANAWLLAQGLPAIDWSMGT
ncbi:MAG: uracil-DNA glycosylase [Bordetella sp.]|uniref:uracil-DNA glycosylase n=1 Tax=Bordetella sp. TaxID=28081 RepID=UPI003F7C7E33